MNATLEAQPVASAPVDPGVLEVTIEAYVERYPNGLTVHDLVEIFGVKINTVYAWIDESKPQPSTELIAGNQYGSNVFDTEAALRWGVQTGRLKVERAGKLVKHRVNKLAFPGKPRGPHSRPEEGRSFNP